MKKTLAFFLLVLATVAFAGAGTETLKVAESYLYVREKTNSNDAPEIDKFLKFSGLGSGYPWCQAFYNYCSHEGYKTLELKSPFPRSASCAKVLQTATSNPMKFKVITSKAVVMGAATPVKGDLASFKHGKALAVENYSYNGHAAVVAGYDYRKRLVSTVEGNTKPTNQGDQTGKVKGDLRYGNDGVYRRVRGLGLDTTFPILAFVRGR